MPSLLQELVHQWEVPEWEPEWEVRVMEWEPERVREWEVREWEPEKVLEREREPEHA